MYTLTPFVYSWLVDVSKDAEGLRVIVDLHGGDETNEQAQAEYQEIKDRVMFEVWSNLTQKKGSLAD